MTVLQQPEYEKGGCGCGLNAINAAFAVIKWKKLLGYYHDTAKEFNTFYRISSNGIINEDNIT